MQVDETPIRYLAPGHGQTKLGYLWTTCRPRGDVIYHWETSRSARCLENVVPINFKGTIQCDAYAAYPGFARKRGLALAGCWAHARRAFYEARDHTPQAAGFILRQIGHLYRIEARLRKSQASPKLRAVVRSMESAPLLARIRHALLRWKTARRFLPKSTMGKALDYTLSNWSLLEVYLGDGRIEPERSGDSLPKAARRASKARQIDNNSVENSIRPTAIGKKNYPSLREGSVEWLRSRYAAIAARQWLFIGAAEAGQRSTILYTIIESCRRRGINPFDYLRDVLTRLPSMTNW